MKNLKKFIQNLFLFTTNYNINFNLRLNNGEN